MRNAFVFVVLMMLRIFSKCFYKNESQWVGEIPEDPWQPYRLVAILNHTSLFEFLFAGQVPARFLWRMASHATIPIAKITIDRPVIGLMWRVVAANIVPVTRERDNTWQQVVESLEDPDSMIIILPEGRMKRANGLDKKGRPMSTRGGIADLIRGLPDGKLLLAYSQGLHHIQVPGQKIPNFFQPVRMRFEALQLSELKAEMSAGLDLENDKDLVRFRRRVMQLLDERRERYCTSDLGGSDEEQVWAEARRETNRPPGA